jgi:C1A family cysteine protease
MSKEVAAPAPAGEVEVAIAGDAKPSIQQIPNRMEQLQYIKLNYKYDPEGQFKWLKKHVVDKNVKLPLTFSLATRYKVKIYDQGQLGSCVVNSFAGVINSLYNVSPSRLYNYFTARVATGNSPVVDSGLGITQSFPYFNSFGYVPESNWEYDIENFTLMPPIDIFKQSSKFNFTYKAVQQDSESIKHALYTTGFVMFGTNCYSSFMAREVAETGIIPIPKRTEVLEGGHCLNIVGWTMINNELYYIVRNSWGASWGNNGSTTPTENFYNFGNNGGFAYFPERYMLDPTLANEFCVIQRSKKEMKKDKLRENVKNKKLKK